MTLVQQANVLSKRGSKIFRVVVVVVQVDLHVTKTRARQTCQLVEQVRVVFLDRIEIAVLWRPAETIVVPRSDEGVLVDPLLHSQVGSFMVSSPAIRLVVISEAEVNMPDRWRRSTDASRHLTQILAEPEIHVT